MGYEVGQTVALEGRRGILGERLREPEWYILTTPPQRELAATAWLDRMGVSDTWYPTETAWRAVPRGPRKKVEYQRCIAPGYLFAQFFRRPVWDVLFEAGRNRVSGVVGFYERPYAIPVKVIGQMQQVPHQIERLRNEESAREKAQRLAKAPRVGEPASIKAGPLAGLVVDVQRIDAGIAHFLINGLAVQATVESMERKAG